MDATAPISRLNTTLEGRYRIAREIGEGGMATVYVADDVRHERKVALKVLKPELAAVLGAERFLAEIKTTANLQHPHILPLFDSGEADSFLFYVMPYVAGETLRARLDREHQLPVDEATRIATNVAEALDYAHRNGVIHRDVKPANILLQDGNPVVSDFGIALAVGAAGGNRLTRTGTSLGTPHYMSPEQATGDVSVGPASDIYALGCVLFEMLTGEPPFTGSTPRAVLGRIITGEAPSATAERPTVPRNVDAAIRRALEKIPADRFATAQDFARALADPAFRHGDSATAPPKRPTPLIAALSVLSLSLAGTLAWVLANAPAPGPPERFVVPFEPGAEITTGGGEWWATPDGTGIVYSSVSGGPLQLRRFSDGGSTPVPGTEGSSTLSTGAISPEGRAVVYRAGNEIRVASFSGGPPRTLMPGRFAGWGEDGSIYVSTDEGLDRVPAGGGEPQPVTLRADGELSHRFSDAVPGGILMVVDRGESRSVEHVDLGSGERTLLVHDATGGRWADGGLLLYLSGRTLMADALDLDTPRMRGQPVSLLTGVDSFVLSDGGRLIYREAGSEAGPLELVWVSRSGEAQPVRDGWYAAMDNVNVGWRLSEDGQTVLFSRSVDDNWDIWTMEVATGELRRLTDHPARDFAPRWSPDQSQVVFASFRTEAAAGPFALWTVPRAGGQAPGLLFDGPVAEGIWSPDGTWLVVRTTTGPQGGGVVTRDILAIRPGVDSVPRSLAASPDAEEGEPEISRDGRWLAYASNTTGRTEVFVQPFPEAAGTRWQVSLNGGVMPYWSRSERELLFVQPDTRDLISVTFEQASSTFRILSRRVLFVVPPEFHLLPGSEAYDESADGRFLMARTPEWVASNPARRLFVIDNWLQDVERRLER